MRTGLEHCEYRVGAGGDVNCEPYYSEPRHDSDRPAAINSGRYFDRGSTLRSGVVPHRQPHSARRSRTFLHQNSAACKKTRHQQRDHPDSRNDDARRLAQFPRGLLLLIASSRLLVWAASNIALSLGVSELVIGLTIVAVGTSLPELAASVTSALKGHADMAVGAIVGSNMFNILLVLAIPGFWGVCRSKRQWSAETCWRYFSQL